MWWRGLARAVLDCAVRWILRPVAGFRHLRIAARPALVGVLRFVDAWQVLAAAGGELDGHPADLGMRGPFAEREFRRGHRTRELLEQAGVFGRVFGQDVQRRLDVG